MLQQLLTKLGLFKPKLDRSEAIASAAMIAVETLAEVQVRTIYGLTHQGMASMFRSSADHLVKASEQAETAVEEAALLLMGKEIMDMADRIEAKDSEPTA